MEDVAAIDVVARLLNTTISSPLASFSELCVYTITRLAPLLAAFSCTTTTTTMRSKKQTYAHSILAGISSVRQLSQPPKSAQPE